MTKLLIALLCLPALAAAEPLFPTPAGVTLTFRCVDPKETWTTKLVERGQVLQYSPHHDILTYATKGGFTVRSDGMYITGEQLAELGPPPAPVRAVAFPLKTGAHATVPGLIPTTYTVRTREKVGEYKAWKIEISDAPNGKGAVWIAPGVGIVKVLLPTGRVDELVSNRR